MRLVDARRLTGRNVLAPHPLVIVEVSLDPEEPPAPGLDVYAAELARMRAAIGLAPRVEMLVRPHAGGAVVGYRAPVDAMLACTEMSEWAAGSAEALLDGGVPFQLEPKAEEIRGMLARDANPRMVQLRDTAEARGLPFLWDDTSTSVGLGKRSITWPNGAIPDASGIPWETVGKIPVAMITGTNGKTTSTRLLARIARESGLVVGSTSTDGVAIGAHLVEEGDFTGPAGARTVLRHGDVELAVLETARGGILRRGLAIDACDVALVTNVSKDHVGGYGVDDVAQMIEVKGVVARAAAGACVLNAGDAGLVAFAAKVTSPVVYFANLDADGGAAAEAVVVRHRLAGGRAVIARGGDVVIAAGSDEEVLAHVTEIPITLGGRARHNVENVLGAVAAASALGIDTGAIRRGVLGFGARDNHGRGEVFEKGGVTILVDFAHNPEGVRAVMQLVGSLRKDGRLTVITGSAGDRREDDIRDISREILAARPDKVLVRELGKYLRGRAPGEMPEMFRKALTDLGLAAGSFAVVGSEVEGLKAALADARRGDVIALLVHVDHDEVRRFLDGLG